MELNGDFVFLSPTNHRLFLERLSVLIWEVLLKEVNVKKEARLHCFGRMYVKPEIILFDHPKEIGHFCPISLRLGFNKKLAFLTQTSILKNVIRHELAHYLCHLELMDKGHLPNGETFVNHRPHGGGFLEMCHRFGWDKSVSEATINFEEIEDGLVDGPKSRDMLDKVKKLLALAQSSNQNESQLAMTKANEILLKYNLDSIGLIEEESLFKNLEMRQILFAKRSHIKQQVIGDILEEFFVNVVYCRNFAGSFIEISGDSQNVVLAQYIANFLNLEFESLWKKAKKNTDFKGLRAKNNFFRGLSKGFIEKIRLTQKAAKSYNQSELVVINKHIELARKTFYPRLRTSRQHGLFDITSFTAGKVLGGKISIRPGIENKGDNVPRLIER